MKLFGITEAQRLNILDKLQDPLQVLSDHIDFEIFRTHLEKIFPPVDPKAPGRRRFDPVVMFKILLLQRLYKLSDEQAEFQLNDRRSFLRFVGLKPSDTAPDHTTIWNFREQLSQHQTVEEIFDDFTLLLTQRGIITKTGVIVDASFTETPRQHNSREENEQIREGEIPQAWVEQPHKLSQKDLNARWTQKKGETFYGYKNHVSVDVDSKLIMQYRVTAANTHDYDVFEQLLPPLAKGTPVYADTAYGSAARIQRLQKQGLQNHIQVKRPRKGLLTAVHKQWNQSCAKVRCRIEHVFAFMQNTMNGPELEYIGIRRITAGVGLNNLVYNLMRFVQITVASPPQFFLFDFRNCTI